MRTVICSMLLLAVAMWPAGLQGAAGSAQPRLQNVQNVYVLPMGGGLDQLLASRLTSKGVFQVVTDPKKADAILTDRIGKSFEQTLATMYPPPPPPEPAKEPETKDEKAKGDEKPVEKPEGPPPSELDAFANAKPDNSPRMGTSTWGRGRGNIFLVERGSGDVIWSTHAPAKNTAPKSVARQADRIVGRLAKDRTQK